MAITNFIPTVWSETLYEALNKHYIAVNNCNRDFDGDIKEMGSKVKICGVGAVNVFEYTKNTDMNAAQTLSDTSAEIDINRAYAFNFQIDDIDRAQSNPKLMKAAMKVAAAALANEADSHVFGLHADAGSNVTNTSADASNIIDSIISAREILYTNNVGDEGEIVLEVSPKIASIILKAKLNLSNDIRDSALNGGLLGNVAGCKIYVSNNIAKTDSVHKCFMRTKRAIAFAEQLSEIHAYRPETRFADAVKGLHLYGAKVVYPEEFVVLNLTAK